MSEDYRIGFHSKEEITSDLWLSLKHFPDETRVKLTKRGRLFVFQSAAPLNLLIDRVTWSRYRSNLSMTIPLSIIRLLMKEEKDLFVLSFMVTSIGSQKTQYAIRLPIQASNPWLMKVLALMCLTRGLFSSGSYQSEHQDKTEAFIRSFEQAFGVKLPVSENKRGYYIKITEQIGNAFSIFFTGIKEAEVSDIILNLIRFSEEAILAFLDSWFTFSRIYRSTSTNDQHLFRLRYNNETKGITALLDKVGVQWDTGSITAQGKFIPTCDIHNSERNRTILNLASVQIKKSNRKKLFKEVVQLRDKIKVLSEKINILEEIIGKLREQLEIVVAAKKKESYSRYYYERKNLTLKERIDELQTLKDELQVENVALKNQITPLYTSPDHFQEHTYEKDQKTIIIEDETEILGYSRIPEVSPKLQETKGDIFLLQPNDLFKEESESRFPRSQTPNSNNTSLRRILFLLLSTEQNWIIFCLASGESKTFTQLKRILSDTPSNMNSMDKTWELRRTLEELEAKNIVQKHFISGEEYFSLNNESIIDIVKNYKRIVTRKNLKEESKLKAFVKKFLIS